MILIRTKKIMGNYGDTTLNYPLIFLFLKTAKLSIVSPYFLSLKIGEHIID